MDEDEAVVEMGDETIESTDYPIVVDRPQCWAFSPSAVRCELAAGHSGTHAVSMTWTDAECRLPMVPLQSLPYPGQGVAGTVTMNHPVQMPDIPRVDTDDDMDIHDGTICIACDHPITRHDADGCSKGCQCLGFVA